LAAWAGPPASYRAATICELPRVTACLHYIPMPGLTPQYISTGIYLIPSAFCLSLRTAGRFLPLACRTTTLVAVGAVWCLFRREADAAWHGITLPCERLYDAVSLPAFCILFCVPSGYCYCGFSILSVYNSIINMVFCTVAFLFALRHLRFHTALR
jgi:hypothetical protein